MFLKIVAIKPESTNLYPKLKCKLNFEIEKINLVSNQKISRNKFLKIQYLKTSRLHSILQNYYNLNINQFQLQLMY